MTYLRHARRGTNDRGRRDKSLDPLSILHNAISKTYLFAEGTTMYFNL